MTVVTKLSLIQLLFTLVFAGVMSVVFSFVHGFSALLGGMVCVIANLFFAGKLFLGKHMMQPEEILQQFYRSEISKLIFTFTMFVLVFMLLNIEFMSFILAYSFAALLNLLCLPFLK